MKTSSSRNKYAARAIIDYGVRRSAEMVETRLRREVLQGLEGVIVESKNANDENKADKKRQAAKAKDNVIEIPRFVAQNKSGQEQHLVEYMEEQARKRGDIEP